MSGAATPRGPIELVCFDLGGVLIRVRESWEETLRLAGVAGAEVVARADAQAVARLMVAYETGRLETPRFFERAAELLAIDPEQARRAMDLWLDEPYEGFDPLLDRLDRAGVATACLSNTSAYHWELMMGQSHASLPLARLTFRFASQQLGWLKPDPRTYAEVERVSGVRPEAIAYYDDRALNVEGALARGWRACRIDPASATIGAIARDLEALGVVGEGAGARESSEGKPPGPDQPPKPRS